MNLKTIADQVRNDTLGVDAAKSALLELHREQDTILKASHARGDKPLASEKRKFQELQESIDVLTEYVDTFEPQYKHDMGATGARRGDGTALGGDLSGLKMLTKDDRLADEPDSQTLGMLGVLAKSLTGDVDERELRQYMPDGMKDMLSSGSAGVIVPTPVAGFVIDRLRARSVVHQLGARVVPMDSKTLSVPRITADPTPSWLAEGAAITASDGAMDEVAMTAKRLTAIVKFSDELDEDSDPELAGDVLATSLAQAFAIELDRAALRGSGTGAEPLGIRNQSGVTIVPTVGAATWTTLTGFKRDLELANSECNGYVLNPRTLDAIENDTDSTGQFIAPPRSIDSISRLSTTSVPSNLGAGTETELYAGNWADLMLGMRIRFELRRLNERYAEEGKVALRARIRADVQLAHGASFVVGTGVTN